MDQINSELIEEKGTTNRNAILKKQIFSDLSGWLLLRQFFLLHTNLENVGSYYVRGRP